jgi:hypothetical protein
MIDEGKSFEEVNKQERVDEEDFRIFKGKCRLAVTQEKSQWGKDMRALNIGNHHLGSGGYDGKEAIWEKEDAELRAQGKENPFDKFENRQAKNFISWRLHGGSNSQGSYSKPQHTP